MNPFVRFIREATAVALWAFVVVKLLVFDIDVYLIDRYAPFLRWILNYKLFILMSLTMALWLLLGKGAFRAFVVYVLAYPFIVLLWKVPKLVFRRWPLAIAFAPAIYNMATTFRSSFILFTLAMLSGLFIAISRGRNLQIPSMVVLGLFLVIHLYRNFRKAYKSSVFSGLSRLAQKIRTNLESGWLGEHFSSELEVDPECQETQDDYQSELQAYYFSNWLFVFVADKLHEVARTRKPDFYLIISWVYTVTVVAIVYAFEYWGLYKLTPEAFSGPETIGFWSLLGFSFSVLTSSEISSVVPSGLAVKLLCYTEVGCTLLVLVILFFTILTAARERYKQDIDEFISELRLIAGTVENQLSILHRITLAEAEIILFELDPQFVNPLRKARGIPELPVPDKQEQEDQDTDGNGT